MTPWAWWAGIPGEETYDLACEMPTREAAVAEAMRQLKPGNTFQIIEARSSTDARYEGADFVPFVRERNHEILVASPRLASTEAPALTQLPMGER